MSLINNALKKAQRQRASETVPGMSAGSSGPHRGGKGMPTQTLVLILAGATVIVVLSVVATVYLLRPTAPAPAAPIATTTTAPVAHPIEQPAQSTVVSMPAIQPEPEPAATPVASTPEPVITVNNQTQTPPATEPITPAISAKADERVYAFIDKLQVMGIRSSGSESKVLMNDRVYRVNDIVERNLMLKLTKVSTDSLTFKDPNGIVYTKNF